MDLATLLANVNARAYATPQQFLADVALIPQVCGAGRHTRAAGSFDMSASLLWMPGWRLKLLSCVAACAGADPCSPTPPSLPPSHTYTRPTPPHPGTAVLSRVLGDQPSRGA